MKDGNSKRGAWISKAKIGASSWDLLITHAEEDHEFRDWIESLGVSREELAAYVHGPGPEITLHLSGASTGRSAVPSAADGEMTALSNPDGYGRRADFLQPERRTRMSKAQVSVKVRWHR